MSVASTLISMIATVVMLTACFVTSAVESSARLIMPARARRLRDSAERGAEALDALVERPARLGAAHALTSGTAFAIVAALAAFLLASVLADVPQWADAILGVFVGVAVVFALGEALPRAFSAANPEDVGLALAPAALLVTRIAYPVAHVIAVPFSAAIHMVAGHESSVVPWSDENDSHRVSEEDEQAMEEAEAMMDAFVGLERKVVREVMVPRTDMVAIEDTATLQEALATIIAAGVSRVPVFHDTVDDVCGVLYAKDLLPSLADPSAAVDLGKLARPAMFVPETKPVDELLKEMRRRTHIALVADEHGGTAGLVTIEDLLEEIVGEIYDEYDPEVSMVTELGEGRTLIDARLSIDEVDEQFGTALDTEADTAAGMFTDLAGHIPQVGESVEVQGLRFTVEAMEGTRVRQLVVEPVHAHEVREEDE